MNARKLVWFLLPVLAAGCGGGDGDDNPAPDAHRAQALATGAAPDAQALSQVAPMYALDFVATAATGWDMNDAGDVVGRSHTDTGCGPFCLPPEEIVVWRGGQRIVLPLVAGYEMSAQFPLFINNQGLIGGMVGIPGAGTHAAAWIPADFQAQWIPPGPGYIARDLGVLPGMSDAEVRGLDELGRMVGWSKLGGAIPSDAAPFMWSQASGWVNLRTLGYPNEMPAAMSPGGKVATTNSWYQLGDPASAKALAPLPRGYVGVGSNGSAINDAGDQAHFLVSINSQNLVYPFRLSNGGTWQMLSTFGTGRLSSAGMGSINAAQDVTFTAGSAGMVAAGPDGPGQGLTPLLSPAYAGASVGVGGPINAAGQILTQVMIGRSQRLMKMTPVSACGADCLVSSSLAMSAQFVEDRRYPGSCFQGGTMYNLSSATVTITSEAGAPLANVQVSGRFMDDYWTNHPVTGTTNAAGVVSWTYQGPCGVGAIAFLVENAALGTRSFDRSRGTLANDVIPGSTPPPANQAPVAVPTATCVAGRTCTLDGRGSYDPDGTIAAYRWAETNGTTLSTQPVFTKTFAKAGKNSVVLHVTDNGGLSASRKVTFTVLR